MDESQNKAEELEAKSLPDTDMSNSFKYGNILFEELENGEMWNMPTSMLKACQTLEQQ